ncbi:MAG: site-specific DNA-methyltransferase, partial [Bacteroidota bacterium]|nr:site-specific DNA-methyltransferase [Bacteroidota bacterium]
MATITKKDKFYSVLKNIFIGAKIEGNSGYVNLMRIKNKYYQDFKGQLATGIDKKLDEVGRNFEEELFNKLYTFFKKYFSESGSIYFSYTPLQEKVYERIYRDDKDVMLFWKTNMLYYVKTERLYQNMDFQDEDNLIWYHFDVSELEHKKNNEKKELIFEYANSHFEDNKREIFFKVKYSKNGSKTKIDDILKKVKRSVRALSSYKEQELKRALGIFRKQSEVDYFINKNAKDFLQEQFSLWIKTYIFDDNTIFEEARLKQLKALRDIAYNIIDLVSQFEDELVKIWNKPKFAHSSNYVITLDKIADKDFTLLEKLLKHKGIDKQIKEWQELGMISDKFNVADIFKKEEKEKELFEKGNQSKLNQKLQFLPLDTKYFKDLEFDILALFDDLDNQLDGWLIHSE